MCETYRIPHSHYLGGPHQWTQLDRDKAEAYRAFMLEHCPDCGTRDEEWDPKQGGHRHAYYADTRRCPGCEVKEQLREQLPDRALGVKIMLQPNVEALLAAEGV